MKIKTEGGTMTAKGKSGLVSKLRFPEFRQAGDWEKKELCEVATIIRKKAGSNKYTLMSVTAGVGLISQLEKFGREIAGAQYKNYLVIEHNDFAYNKSATKEYPEGFIGMYSGNEPGAVPNSIFTCFRVDTNAVVPKYLNYLFFLNLHGKWLKKFITVGARAHGSLNIDDNDLLALPVPFPRGSNSITEQQKIADCLSSLDELIAAQAHKLDTLKAHKKGLMQQLFPAPGQTTPTLRFPEFQDAGEWKAKNFGEVCKFVRGPFGGALKKDIFVKSGYAVYEQSHAIYQNFDSFRYFITEEKYKELKRFAVAANDIIMSCSGTMGKFAIVPKDSKEGVINQALLKLTVRRGFNIDFIKYTLELPSSQEKLLSQSAGGAIKNVVGVTQLKEIEIDIPNPPEQQKIADCLSSLDELIAAQAHKLDILKAHKKGLMQQLFPNPDEAAE